MKKFDAFKRRRTGYYRTEMYAKTFSGPVRISNISYITVAISHEDLLAIVRLLEHGPHNVQEASEGLYDLIMVKYFPKVLYKKYDEHFVNEILIPKLAIRNFSIWTVILYMVDGLLQANNDLYLLTSEIHNIATKYYGASRASITAKDGQNISATPAVLFGYRLDEAFIGTTVMAFFDVVLDFSKIGEILVHEEYHGYGHTPEPFYTDIVPIYDETHVYEPLL